MSASPMATLVSFRSDIHSSPDSGIVDSMHRQINRDRLGAVIH
jgi:hypothetical protein